MSGQSEVCLILIFIWLEDKIRSEEIDKIISGEIPDTLTDPELFDIVSSYMIHGPFGAFNMTSPYMEDGKCKKRFQKRYTMVILRISMVIHCIAVETLIIVATYLQCECEIL